MGTEEKSPKAQTEAEKPVLDEKPKTRAMATKSAGPSFKLSLTSKELTLVKKHISSDATDDEFALFIYDSQMRGLNPLKKEIYFIKRQTWDTKTSSYKGVASHQVSIDGMRIIAEKTRKYNGQSAVEYGPLVQVNGAEVPEYAEVGVFRKGCERPTIARAYFAEYVQTYRNKKTGKDCMGHMWAKMPRHMIAKCAESLALRKAFPDTLGGLYSNDELPEVEGGPDVTEASVTVVEEEGKAFSDIPNNPSY